MAALRLIGNGWTMGAPDADQTERQTDKILSEFKVVSKQVEGLKLYNEQKKIQIQAQLDLIEKLKFQRDV